MVPTDKKVYLATGFTDMRKSINGLSEIVQDLLGEELFSESLFVFCNKAQNRLKILYWDSNGFVLWLKRLEKDKFKWPKNEREVLQIKSKALHWLLAGLDMSQAHERLNYQYV